MCVIEGEGEGEGEREGEGQRKRERGNEGPTQSKAGLECIIHRLQYCSTDLRTS